VVEIRWAAPLPWVAQMEVNLWLVERNSQIGWFVCLYISWWLVGAAQYLLLPGSVYIFCISPLPRLTRFGCIG
jgi:hypothetical protein